MRCSIRLVLLLIFAIVLRGLAGTAFAMPAMNVDPIQMSGCAEHANQAMPTLQPHHQPDDKACQIACDLGTSPALTSAISLADTSRFPVLAPTLLSLAISGAAPPDHPPPIR
ncbi:MAG: hypothetical protein H6R14_2732 [Proteobacteria bacterium]|nr:hypothetical protein [Pseudomonadota bacterium]